jgi:hypothetical protein
LRNREAAEATAEAVRKHGVQAWTVRANIGEPAAIDRRLAAHPARALHFLHSKTHAAP